MPKIYLTTVLRRHTGGASSLEFPGETVSDVFARLTDAYPAVKPVLRDPQGHLLRHINVFVNGENIRDLDGEGTAVEARDEIQIIPAMAGG